MDRIRAELPHERNPMTSLRTLGIASALAFTLSLGIGTVGCGGGGAKVDARSTTLGQELQDLDEAYKKGLLSQKEYEKKRKEIMKKY